MSMGMFELILLFSGLFGGLGLPLGLPPAEFDQRVARFAPSECLLFVGWSGTGTPEAGGNPTENWLAQPGIAKMLARFRSNVAQRRIAFVTRTWSDDTRRVKAVRCLKKVTSLSLQQPTSIFVTRFNLAGGVVRDLDAAVLVVLEGKSPDIKQDFDEWKESVAVSRKKPPFGLFDTGTPAGQAIKIRLSGKFSLFVLVTDDLALVCSSASSLQEGLANLDTPPPKWLTDLQDAWPVERISSLSRIAASGVLSDLVQNYEGKFDVPSLNSWSREIGALTNLSGLDRMGFVSHTELQVTDNQWGLLGILPAEPLPREILQGLDAAEFLGIALRLDTVRVMELIRQVAQGAGFEASLNEALDEIERFTGVDFEEQVLSDLGNLVTLSLGAKVGEDVLPEISWHGSIAIDETLAFPETWQRMNEAVVASIERLSIPVSYATRKRHGSVSQLFWTKDDFQGLVAVGGWTVIDDQLFLRGGITSVDNLKTAIGETNGTGGIGFEVKQDVPFLRQDSMQQEIADFYQLGRRPGFVGPLGIMRINWENAFELMGDASPEGQILQYGSSVAHLTVMQQLRSITGGTADFGQRSGFLKHLSWTLPPKEEWFAGVRPSYSALYRTDRGYYVRHRQTMPTSSPMAAAIAGLVLASPEALAEYLQHP